MWPSQSSRWSQKQQIFFLRFLSVVPETICQKAQNRVSLLRFESHFKQMVHGSSSSSLNFQINMHIGQLDRHTYLEYNIESSLLIFRSEAFSNCSFMLI